jgi:LacI family transcriptional regulator
MKHDAGFSGGNQRKKMTERKRPTLVDVAREAGVGTTTVSRIINGGHYVDAGTMARVQAVMKRLEYQPNHAARALKGERSHTIGLIVPSLRDEFFANLADTVQMLARSKDYVLIVLASADDAAQETKEIAVFQSHRIDGLIVVPPRVQTQAFLAAVQGLQVPVVAIDRPLLSRNSSVTCDNFEAAVAATQHLVNHGRRRILCLGGDPDLYTIQERQRGYKLTVESAGLKTELIASADVEQIRRTLVASLKRSPQRRPDAIFCLLNAASIMAYENLPHLGLSMPEDIALVGFDDFPLSATLRPAVSVIRQPLSEIGRAATRLIFEQIESGVRSPHHLTLGTEFVPRKSCGCR